MKEKLQTEYYAEELLLTEFGKFGCSLCINRMSS